MEEGDIRKDVLFFAKLSCLSVVAKILIIVLLSYPSLAALASYISVYVWSPWFIVSGSQAKPEEAIVLIER